MERGEKRKSTSRAESSPSKMRRRVTRLDGGIWIDQGDLIVVERIHLEFLKHFDLLFGSTVPFVPCDVQSMIEINSEGDYRVKTLRIPETLPKVPKCLLQLEGLEEIRFMPKTKVPRWLDQLPTLRKVSIVKSEHGDFFHRGSDRDDNPTNGAVDIDGTVPTIAIDRLLNTNAHKLFPFPAAICSLTGLRSLEVIGTNHLPKEIGTLVNLETLTVRAHQEYCYGDPGQLYRLTDGIKHCTNLLKLDLSDSWITLLPRSIGNLKNMEWMSLQNARELE